MIEGGGTGGKATASGSLRARRAATVARPSDPPSLWACRAAILLGWALILSGLGLFAWDGLLWLRDGTWSRETLADLWGRAPLGGAVATPGWDDMRGIHYLLYCALHWLGHAPIGLALVVLGLLAAWAGNRSHEGIERRLGGLRRRAPTR